MNTLIGAIGNYNTRRPLSCIFLQSSPFVYIYDLKIFAWLSEDRCDTDLIACLLNVVIMQIPSKQT